MLAGSQSALLVLSHNMSQSLMEKAFDACKKSYSEESEGAAVAAVEKWLDGADDRTREYEKKDGESKTILEVASENGYLGVVKKLLEYKDLVEFELNARVTELKERSKQGEVSFSFSKTSKGFQVADKATPSGFTLARQAAKGAAEWDKSKSELPPNEFGEWKCKQVRCTSCYDMITLYTYIGEEIPDVTTLLGVIGALRELKWVTMDDIQDHWVKFSDDLREKNVVARPLVAQLSEARYNYGSWNKQFKDEDKLIKRKAKLLDLFKKPSSLVSHEEIKHFLRFFWTPFFATILSLIVFVPVFVLIFHYDLVHYEEQLWSECFVWLGFFSLGKYSVCVRSVLT